MLQWCERIPHDKEHQSVQRNPESDSDDDSDSDHDNGHDSNSRQDRARFVQSKQTEYQSTSRGLTVPAYNELQRHAHVLPEVIGSLETGSNSKIVHTFTDYEQYSSVSLLGRGGIGVVDKIQHGATGKVFARKQISLGHQDGFAIEIDNLCRVARMESIHCMKSVGTYHDNLSYNIIFPVARMSLAELLDGPAPITNLDYTTTFEQLGCLASALGVLHSGNGDPSLICCHMDLKPSNILVFGEVAEIGTWMISDFGATVFEDKISSSSEPIKCVTQKYRPAETNAKTIPEACSADIFALGCVYSETISWLLRRQKHFQEFQETNFSEDKSYHHNLTEVLRWLGLLSAMMPPEDAPKLKMTKWMMDREPRKRPKAFDVCRVFRPGPCCNQTRPSGVAEGEQECEEDDDEEDARPPIAASQQLSKLHDHVLDNDFTVGAIIPFQPTSSPSVKHRLSSELSSSIRRRTTRHKTIQEWRRHPP